MSTSGPDDLDSLVRQALTIGDVDSAAVFAVDPAGGLDHAAAAGIDGPALDGLVAAVRHPAHPVARAVADAGPTFDVRPMNPGGPALRSHLPLRTGGRTLGVLALAHETAVTSEDRDRAVDLAGRMATILARDEGVRAAVRRSGSPR